MYIRRECLCYDFQFNLSTKNYIRQASAFFRQRLSNRQHFRQESKRKFFLKLQRMRVSRIRHNIFLARIGTATIYISTLLVSVTDRVVPEIGFSGAQESAEKWVLKYMLNKTFLHFLPQFCFDIFDEFSELKRLKI